MASQLEKRHTQLDFRKLRGLWESSSPNGASEDYKTSLAKEASPKRLNNPIAEATEPTTSQNRMKLEGHRVRASVAAKIGSPWEHYEKMYALRLGLDHRAIVAEERHALPGELANVYSIRQFTDSGAQTKQDMFRDIQHQNFVTAYDIFWFEDICYVALEYMPCSLYEVRGNEHLTERRLASIIGQILDGLSYLEQMGLEHGSLTCSNIFLSYDGIVQIGEQEQCHGTQPGQSVRKDVRDLGPIVMSLITGDDKDDTDILDRWSRSCALDFAIKTASAASMADVLQHPLLQLPWREVSLKGLVNFGIAKARRGCRAMVDQ